MTVAIASGAIGMAVMAAPSGAGPAEKVQICHRTGSQSNPSVVIVVNDNSRRVGHAEDADSCEQSTTTTSTTTTTIIPHDE